jgi:hypothetical protein
MGLTLDQFETEIQAAAKSYDRHIVCLEKPPDDCLEALGRLMTKAIEAYENRGPGLRHGIALDRHLTIILSETEGDRPLCGIYFNLRSPYQKAAGD